MTSIYDFELLQKKCLRKFNEINLNKKITDIEKERIGFYYYIIDKVLGIRDVNEATEIITDTNFLKNVCNIDNIDLGIDAVHIDDEEKIVYLFNFKYREKYIDKKNISSKDIMDSIGFLNLIFDENKLNELMKSEDSHKYQVTIDKVQEIILRKNDPNSSYSYKFYFTYNSGGDFYEGDMNFEGFKDTFKWLEVYNINLDDISEYLKITSKDNQALLKFNDAELLAHEQDGYSTSNSYVAKIKLLDVIRITGDDINFRMDLGDITFDKLDKLKIDESVLFANVRGYLGETTYNNNILKTLKTEPTMFFLYNNGLTAVADDVSVTHDKLNNKYNVKLINYKIVNGGQTLRTIYKFLENEKDLISNLSNASVLIRFLKTSSEDNLTNKIAEYTNSQNAISSIDLKSVNSFQLEIEARFKEEGILYLRKRSEDEDENIHKYNYIISMEKLGQLLLADKGHPEKVSNNKKKIFTEYYDILFNKDENGFMKNAVELVKMYHLVNLEYKKYKDKYKFYEQKVFYLIYINNHLKGNSIFENIEILESAIQKYRADDEISQARKIIQKGFKEILNEELKGIDNKIVINETKLK